MVFNLEKDKTDPKKFSEYRKAAKTITFGILYGQGIKTLSHNLGITEADCRELQNKFKQSIEGYAELLEGLTQKLNDRKIT